MLISLIYFVSTILRTRKERWFYKEISKIFEMYSKQNSVMFYPMYCECAHGTKCSVAGCEGWTNSCVTSQLCTNKDHARVRFVGAFDNTLVMYALFPQQEIDMSSWLKHEDPLFPLDLARGKESFKFKSTINILIETTMEYYHDDTTEYCLEIGNYAVIKAWKANKYLNFILETDIAHVTNLISTHLLGQYYINNNLRIKRIESVKVRGKPCIFKKNFPINSPLRSPDIVIEFSKAAETALATKKSVQVFKYPGIFIHPHVEADKNVKPETKDKDKDKDKVKDKVKALENVTDKPSIDDVVKAALKHEIRPVTALPMENNVQNGPQTASTSKAFIEETKTKPTTTKTHKVVKPPNVLVYSHDENNKAAAGNMLAILQNLLEPDTYTIYRLTKLEASTSSWLDQVALIVIVGEINISYTNQFGEYVKSGGKILALCSNLLFTMLPQFGYKQNSELVTFSYGKWNCVRLLQESHGYQPYSKRTSDCQLVDDDSDQEYDDDYDSEHSRDSHKMIRKTLIMVDYQGKRYHYDVKVLARKEKSQIPCILLINYAKSGGKMVFSQIHLEKSALNYDVVDYKAMTASEAYVYNTLDRYNTDRIEIIRDLLKTHLEMDVLDKGRECIENTAAYLLSETKDLKLKFLEDLKKDMKDGNILEMPGLRLQFTTDIGEDQAQFPSVDMLPIFTDYSLIPPTNFSSVHYFNSLSTKELGKLVIYTDVITSSMDMVGHRMSHGLIVIPRQQTNGIGRRTNIWLSPVGCAMFTLQIHISRNSNLGKRISIIQHIVAVAMITAVKFLRGYENLPLRIKWPNDIYFGESTKIGGIIVRTFVEQSTYICNIGAAINLSNSKPTTCLNDIILDYNKEFNTRLEKLTYERYIALVLNRLEAMLDEEENSTGIFRHLYHHYWLHKDQEVTIVDSNEKYQKATVMGIDLFGHLRVNAYIDKVKAEITVHPDGNRFDLLKGLIVPTQ